MIRGMECTRARLDMVGSRAGMALVLVLLLGIADASRGDTVVRSDTASIGSFVTERALCPEGTIAVGGGIDLANVLTMSVTSSAPVLDDGGDRERLLFQSDGTQPAPIGWQANARNDSSDDGTLKVAAVCESAPGAVTVVGSDSASVDSFAAKRVLCPEGTIAVGGGIDLANVFTMSVTSSAPVFDDGGDGERLISKEDGTQPAPIGWQASARNENSADGTLKVAAVCESAPGAVTVVGSDSASIDSFAAERVLCPEGTIAVGGGIDLANVFTMSVTSSAPVFDDGGDGDRLISKADGTQPAPIGWQASARNESSDDGTLKVAVICVPEPEAFLGAIFSFAVVAILRGLRPSRGLRRRAG